MSIPKSIMPAFCGLLLATSLPVAARDVRPADPDGKPPCQVSSPSVTPADADAQGPAAAAGSAKPRAPAVPEATSGVRPPRWHSFLPGMFR